VNAKGAEPFASRSASTVRDHADDASSVAGRAFHGECPPEGLDAIGETPEPRSPAGIGTADTIILDLHSDTPGCELTKIRTFEADAYFATFASASVQTK
jgi:hypothetical protein